MEVNSNQLFGTNIIFFCLTLNIQSHTGLEGHWGL